MRAVRLGRCFADACG